MITATIGKIFLEAYNEKYGTDYDAKTFFVEVYHPLFFDSNKYLQWVQNSPFVQGLETASNGEFCVKEIIKDENGKTKKFNNNIDVDTFIKCTYQNSISEIVDIKKEKLSQVKILWKINSKQIARMLDAFLKKVEDIENLDASIAPGYPAADVIAPTSGQVTNLNLVTNKDDIFFSWIGSSLGIGIKGGYILLSEKEILLDLFEGWKLYRKFLNENARLKGNQINAWNGQWLAHCYNTSSFFPEHPIAGFNPFEITNDGMSIATLSWTKIFIRIAQHFNNLKTMGYFYGFDQKTKLPITLGFIPINLEGIRRPLKLYQKFFGMKDNENNKSEILWGTAYSFKESCKLGVIGIKAMQPKDLSDYMTAEKSPKYDDQQEITFKTYIIWLIAMLNNEELWTKSITFACALQKFVKQDKSSINTQGKNAVKAVLSATTKKNFISSLGVLIPDAKDVNCFEETAKIVHMMPSDNVPYFLTLIRFQYAMINKQANV